jgi:hypothetical protein
VSDSSSFLLSREARCGQGCEAINFVPARAERSTALARSYRRAVSAHNGRSAGQGGTTMETKLTADVVVLLDGQPFDIAQALAEVHRRVALVRAIEREAQRLYRDARACVA